MEQLQMSSGGRTARNIFAQPNPVRFALFALAVLLSMATWLVCFSTPALGQSECLLNCEERYNSCLNSQHPDVFCEDGYTTCVDSCLGRGAIASQY